LASCGTPAPEANDSANQSAAAHPAANGGAPAPRAALESSANQTVPFAVAIPAALRGRWGLTAADCTSDRGDSKGLLEITGTELRFYESRGTLGAVTESSESRIAGEFDFEGEGQTWQRLVILEAIDGGRTLTRREAGDGATKDPLRYRRCGG
jgi:hypothetical protein